MAKWKMTALENKAIKDVEYVTDGKNVIIYTSWYRSGSYEVETPDDNEPVIEENTDIYSSGYEVSLIDTGECYSDDYDTSRCDEATLQELEEKYEGSWNLFDLLDEGWYTDELETYINCDVDYELM